MAFLLLSINEVSNIYVFSVKSEVRCLGKPEELGDAGLYFGLPKRHIPLQQISKRVQAIVWIRIGSDEDKWSG